MTPEQHRLAGSLFDTISELPEAQWPLALRERCGPDTELASYLLRLLQADQRLSSSAFLAGGALQDAAQLVTHDPLQGPAIGTVIGSFRVEKRLGAGGMGIVYEATDLRLDRRVALKLLPVYSDSEQEVRVLRFQREARAASQLNHPHIVSILDAGCDQGFNYIAMELVEGKTLRKLIEENQGRRFEDATVIEVLSQTASALSAAHDGGIIHRDVKPENIMLRPDGFVKVLDFGLAAMIAGSGQSTTGSLTQPGHVAGTMSYISPEQLMGKPSVPQSDLWGLGVVAYELATGTRPFRGATDAAVINSILNADPTAPRELCPAISGDLEVMILRLLEKDPQLRFQTASDLRSSCRRISRDFSAPKPGLGAGRGRPRWKSMMATAAVVSLIAAAGAMVVQQTWLPHAGAIRQITHDGSQKEYFVTDGKRLYYSAGMRTENTAMYAVNLSGGDRARVPLPSGFMPVDISGDGSQLLLFKAPPTAIPYPVWTASPLGGVPRKVGDIVANDAHWSNEADRILYAVGNEIRTVRTDGSEVLLVAKAPGPVFHVAWSLDNQTIYFSVLNDHISSLWEVSVDGSGMHRVITGDAERQVGGGGWLPDARSYVFSITNNLQALSHRGPFGFLPPKLVQLTNGPLDADFPTPTPDGRGILFRGRLDSAELVRYDRKSSIWIPYASQLAAMQVDFSRDGKWITYASHTDNSVWRAKADGSERVQLTVPPLLAHNPRWSPDGTQITFYGGVRGTPDQIHIVSATGGAVKALTNSRDITNSGSTYSPSGKLLAFEERKADGSRHLVMADLQTRLMKTLPGSEEMWAPNWSPDGRYIAGLGDPETVVRLYDTRTQRQTKLNTGIAGWPSWSRDSRYIYYLSNGKYRRIGIQDNRVEEIVDMQYVHVEGKRSFNWVGITPDGTPLCTRDLGSTEIYSLEWR